MNFGGQISGIIRRVLSSLPTEQRRFIRKIIYRVSPFRYDFALDENVNTLKRKINLYFRLNTLKRNRFSAEIDFLNKRSSADNLSSFVFPYPFVFNHDYNSVEVFNDEEKGLLYVVHNGRRLYYSREYQSEEAVKVHYSGISVEQDEKSPHRYLTGDFNVAENDTVIDIGAAEGNFSLDVVENAGALYIFEPDKKWVEALNATFEPWKEKVHIINKYAGESDSDYSVSLDSFFGVRAVDFIKIDAEGAEASIFKGSGNIINNSKSLRMAVCTYHRKNDAETLEKLLCDNGFRCTFSEGYMLFVHGKLTPPYFRRALIRARKTLI